MIWQQKKNTPRPEYMDNLNDKFDIKRPRYENQSSQSGQILKHTKSNESFEQLFNVLRNKTNIIQKNKAGPQAKLPADFLISNMKQNYL